MPQLVELAPGHGVGRRSGHQGDDVVGVHLQRRNGGDDLPGSHHRDPIGEREDLIDPMGDHQHREPAITESDEQRFERPGLHDPECCRRLVEDEDPGPGSQGPGDRDHLPLTARQLANRYVEVGDPDADVLEQPLRGPPHPVVLASHPSELGAEEDVGDGVEVVAQRQVLPHDRDRLARDELDGPPVGRGHPRDASHQRGLAGTVLSDEGHDLAPLDVQIHFEDPAMRSEGLRQSPDAQHAPRLSTDQNAGREASPMTREHRSTGTAGLG
ncbi:MAG: hypothetical protein R2715_21535 [Ilumatobacteraceae bacterium]